MELLDLWSRWFSGEQLGQERFLGWPLLAWGRLGKGLQFLAALTVVLDLIGPDRLRAVGRRLRRDPWRRLADFAEQWAPILVGVVLLGCLGVGFLSPAAWSSPWFAVVVLLAFVGVGYTLIPTIRRTTGPEEETDNEAKSESLYTRLSTLRTGMNMSVLVELSFALPFLVVASLPALAWGALHRGIFIPATRGVAVLLDRHRPAHPARWAAFAFFLVGFHFDLLAS